MDGEVYLEHMSVPKAHTTGPSAPIQVGNSSSALAGPTGYRDPEYATGGSFPENSGHLISFSPQLSPSSDSSELTPFSSRFTSTASSSGAPEVDLVDSSREDLYALEGTSTKHEDGRPLSELGILRKVEHATLNRINRLDLETTRVVRAQPSKNFPLCDLLQKEMEEQKDSSDKAGGLVGLRVVPPQNGRNTSWIGPGREFADAGVSTPMDSKPAQHLKVIRAPHADRVSHVISEDESRQRKGLGTMHSAEGGASARASDMDGVIRDMGSNLQAAALPPEDLLHGLSGGGLDDEDLGWNESRRRRQSAESARTTTRSITGVPSDPGNMPPTRSQSMSRHRRGSSQSEDGMFKVKFLCSNGGEIKFTDGKLRYVGGETRIFTVSRDITYSELMFKLTEFYGEQLSLKYQLPDMDLDVLLSVSNDEDLKSMMEEYDEIEKKAAEGKAQRLRLFLFSAEGKEGHYGEVGGNFEKHFGMEDAVPQEVLRATYHVDDVEQRPGTGGQYPHQVPGHFAPSGTDLMVLDSKGHHSRPQPQPQDLMVQPKLPPLHLQYKSQHPPQASYSHASSPRRSPSETPVLGPDSGPSIFSAGLPRLDLPAAVTQEQLQQQQQQKLQQLQLGALNPYVYEDIWQLQQQGEFRPPEHSRQDLPPLHPTRNSPPSSTQEHSGMLRVRSRDNLSRLGDMAGNEGQQRSTTSSPRYEDQGPSAFSGNSLVDPYSHQGLPPPPRPPSAGQQGRLGQHTQSDSALDLQEGQFGSRLPQPPSMPHLNAGLPGPPTKPHHPVEPASPGYSSGQFKKTSGLAEFAGSNPASPHETPRYLRRHSAVEGSSPPMVDVHLQHPPSHVDPFLRQHGQHPRSLPGSPRQMAYHEPESWHQDHTMSRFAHHGASEGSGRGSMAEQAAGLGNPGGPPYRGRAGEGLYRWAGDPGYRRVEQAGDMEQLGREPLRQQGYLDEEHGGRSFEGGHSALMLGGEQRLGRRADSQFGEWDPHGGEHASWMQRSSSQRQLQEMDQYQQLVARPWPAEGAGATRSGRPDQFERDFRQDSGARDGLPGLAGPWEEARRDGHLEEYMDVEPEAWQEGRRGPGWGPEAGRGSMTRRGSSQDLQAQYGGDGGQPGPDSRFFPEEGPEAGALLQRRGSRRELHGALALPAMAARYGAGGSDPRASPREMLSAKLPDFIFSQQPPVSSASSSTAVPLPVSGFQHSDSYPALGDTPPPAADALQPSDMSFSQSRPPLHPTSPGKGAPPRTPYSSLNSPDSDAPVPAPPSLAALSRPDVPSQKDLHADSPGVSGDGSSLGPMADRGGKPVYLPSPAKAPTPVMLPELQRSSRPMSSPCKTLIDAGLLAPSDLPLLRPQPVSILQQPAPTSPVPPLVFDGFSSPLSARPSGPPIPPLESVLSMDPHFGIPPSLPRLLPTSADPLSGITPISETSLAEPVPLFRASPPHSPTTVMSSGISAAWSAALAASDSPTRGNGEAADWAATKLAEDMAAAVLQSPLKASPLEEAGRVPQPSPSAAVSRPLRRGSGEKPAVSIAPLRILEPEWGSAGLKMLAESGKGRGSSWGRNQTGPAAGREAEQAGDDAAVVVPVSKGPGFVKIHPEAQKVVSPSLQERVIQEQRLSLGASTLETPPTSGPPSPVPLPSPEPPRAPLEQPQEQPADAVNHADSSKLQQKGAERTDRASGDRRDKVEAPSIASAATPPKTSKGPSTLHSEQLRLVDDQMRFQSQSQLLSETPSPLSPEDSGVDVGGAGPSAAQAEAAAKYAGLQEIFNEDLEEIRELGSGTFGTVHYGKWRGTDVAIKRLKASVFNGGDDEDRTGVIVHSGDISLSGDLPVEVIRRQNKEIADFWKEAELLSSLHHPNVVAFYGVVKDKGKPVATVTEYMVNGSLKQVLQKKDRTIDRKKRILIAMDASFGMEYLHSKHIVHFDLKCDNLLVNMRDPQRPVCKVGDLGLSKIKKKTMCSGGVRGTLPWMAPELLDGNSHFVTEKVDVFSFGIVLWELLTGEEPYHDMHHGAIIGGIVNNSLRPTIPTWCDPAWRALMERCWAQDQKARPSFKEISDELRAMYGQLSKPSRT